MNDDPCTPVTENNKFFLQMSCKRKSIQHITDDKILEKIDSSYNHNKTQTNDNNIVKSIHVLTTITNQITSL